MILIHPQVLAFAFGVSAVAGPIARIEPPHVGLNPPQLGVAVTYPLGADDWLRQWEGQPGDSHHLECVRTNPSAPWISPAAKGPNRQAFEALEVRKARGRYLRDAGSRFRGRWHVFLADDVSTSSTAVWAESVRFAGEDTDGPPILLPDSHLIFEGLSRRFTVSLDGWYDTSAPGIYRWVFVYHHQDGEAGDQADLYREVRAEPIYTERMESGELRLVPRPEWFEELPDPSRDPLFTVALEPTGDGLLSATVTRAPHREWPMAEIFSGIEDLLIVDCKPVDPGLPTPTRTDMAASAAQRFAARLAGEFAPIADHSGRRYDMLMFHSDRDTTETAFSSYFEIPGILWEKPYYEDPARRILFAQDALTLPVRLEEWVTPQSDGAYQINVTFVWAPRPGYGDTDRIWQFESNSILMDWSREGGWKPVPATN